ncbi:MAG TPA: heavy-metal-associated domain-containing protein [Membranihabitans sp.]|nr:heavy-metal-associated domain-containing protein [Membranihabitans sp.]
MKNLLGTILLLFIFSTGFAQKGDTETIAIQTNIYCDHCLECPDCGVNIYKAVRKNSGIKKVEVEPEENVIHVTYKTDKTTPEEIRQSIADIGFDADDIKASPTAYENLDACCKKQ